MAYYKKVYNEKFGVYYPSAVVMGSPVSTKKLARRLSQMCTVTYADVMAVLGELPGVMADYMGQGKSVRLEGLGTFRYTLKTNGVADEADFDFQKQVERPAANWCPPASNGCPTTPQPPRAATRRNPARARRRETATKAPSDDFRRGLRGLRGLISWNANYANYAKKIFKIRVIREIRA